MVAHRATGKLAPITTATYDDSNIEVFGDGGLIPLYRIVPKQEREADPKPLHLNHFTNCPRREAFGGRAR
jgi:hypothetical protein